MREDFFRDLCVRDILAVCNIEQRASKSHTRSHILGKNLHYSRNSPPEGLCCNGTMDDLTCTTKEVLGCDRPLPHY